MMSRNESKRQIITTLNRLDLNVADYEEIKFLVNDLISGAFFEFQTLAAGQIHYRARRMLERPSCTSELMSPPDYLVSDFQRCNPPLRATMYCSSCSHSAMREISVTEGETVYLSHWKQRDEVIVATLTSNRNVVQLDECADIISTFFETKYSQPIHDVFSSQYKVTSAIFEMMMDSEPTLFDLESNIRADILGHGVHAMIYRSIANRQESHCIAFKPEFAKEHLEVQYVEERVVTKINYDNIEYDITGGTYVFHDPIDGDIVWGEGRQICSVRGLNTENELLAGLESRRRGSKQ